MMSNVSMLRTNNKIDRNIVAIISENIKKGWTSPITRIQDMCCTYYTLLEKKVLKEPLKVLKAPWGTFIGPCTHYRIFKGSPKGSWIFWNLLRVQELGFHIRDNEEPF